MLSSNFLPINKIRSKKGFSIIELMIALAITSIAIIAIYNLFISQQRGFMIQEEVANMQQNNRVAMEDLSRVIKMAGAGVLPPQQKILYCGPYDFRFSGNLNATENDVMALGAQIGVGLYIAPDPTPFVNQDAETYRWTLDKDGNGVINAGDYTNTTSGAEQYSLWREVYSGNTLPIVDEVAPNIAITDTQGNPIVLFQYWGNFDADDDLDLWGDTLPFDGELQQSEIISNGATGALDPVVDLTGAGRALDDMLQMVDVTVITETQRRDPNYPTNSGYRQTRHSSLITPRNLWTCSNIEVVAGYPNSLKVTKDHTDNYGPIQFLVTESGIAKQGKIVNFSAQIGGIDITAYGGTITTKQEVSGIDGLVNVGVGIPDCVADFPIGGTITVTAMLPYEVTPFGPCSADFDIASITLIPGPPFVLEVTSAPTATTLFSCGYTADAAVFDITVKDACGNPVPPKADINLKASGVNVPCVDGFGDVEPDSISITTSTVTVTYTSSTDKADYDAVTRTGPGNDQFEVRILDDFSGAFDCLAPLVTLYVETFPDHITVLTDDISGAAHTDCNYGAPSSQVTFNVEDSCGNLVYDMAQLTLTQPKADIDVTFTPDPNGVLNNPDDQGSVSIDPVVNVDPAKITTSVGGVYTVTYTEPFCTLPPLYSKILHPVIDLTPNNFVNQGPLSYSPDLQSCTDCEVTTSKPTMSACISDTEAEVLQAAPFITAVFCGIDDGTPVELQVTGGASFDITNPNVSTISGTFTADIFSTQIFIGNAVNGAKLSVTAYSPDFATYLTDPAGFTCSGIDIITVQSLCKKIRVSNQILQLGTPDITAISSGDLLYVEIDDCNQNKDSTSIEYIDVTVTSPQGYTPPMPDIETVILTETGMDTGIFNSNVFAGTNPGPLSVIYCGLGGVGDTSYNGTLFVRPGFDVTVQYIDPADPFDSGCIKVLNTNPFTCPAFIYSYFGNSYIHLDRHGITADLSLGGNIFTNGEFELSGDMHVDGTGPDGVYGTADDYVTVSLGHMSIAGDIVGDCYAPSFDLYGPDGAGQNTQVFPPNEGVVQGNVYLMDGFKFDSVAKTYSPEVVGSRGNPPSYGTYDSLAADAIATKPPGSAVQVHAVTGGMSHAGALIAMPNEPGYPFDPNIDPSYGLPVPNPNAKVLVAKELPVFNYTLSAQKALNMAYNYHSSIGDDTYFTSMAEFEDFVITPRSYTALDGTSYTSPHTNAQGKTIYIIGDPYEGTVFHFPGSFETLKFTKIGADEQIIIHGMIVAEQVMSIRGKKVAGHGVPVDGGMAIYSCGTRPPNWIEGWTGVTYTDYQDWLNVRGVIEEPIPYDMIALVGKTKLEVKDRGTHIVIKGIVYSEAESHFHCGDPEGKVFFAGAEIANVIHNCLYMDFLYNDCVRKAAVEWYGCYCDTGGKAVPCGLSISPTSASVVKGGQTLTLTASNSISGTYAFSLAGSSGGSIAVAGDTAVYTSGVSSGIDTITVTSAGCVTVTATITVTDTCVVTVVPESVTVPIGQSQIINASSAPPVPPGGPFTWAIIQNQSGGSLDLAIGDAVTYTAGIGGGIDIINVSDAAGCADSTATVNVDTNFVKIEIYEYSGVACTTNPVDNVVAGGEVCVITLLGDPDSAGFTWYTTDVTGTFYDTTTGTWVGSGVFSTLIGETVRYKAGVALATYTITAMDDESNIGNHLLSTCDITLAPATPTIFETETIDFVGWVGPAAPPRTVASWQTTDPAGGEGVTINVTSPTEATYTPSAPGLYVVSIFDNVGCEASSNVTVTPCPSFGILPSSPADVSYRTGNTETFTTSAGVSPITWSSSDLAVGTIVDVADTGVFTPQGLGVTTVTATDDAGCQDTVVVTVKCPVIDIEPDDPTLELALPAETVDFSEDFGSSPYTWSSSDPAVATINAGTGLATGVGLGTTTITVVDNLGCSETTTLTVTCDVITIAPDTSLPVNTGTIITFSVTSGGVTPYTWTSSDTGVGVFAPGTSKMLARGAGTTTVTVTDAAGCTNTTTVTVNCTVVTVSPDNPDYVIGQTDTFTAAGGQPLFTWTSSNPAVGTIVAGSGFFTAVSKGSTTIEVTDIFGCTDTTTATVCNETLTVTRFDINCSSNDLYVEGTSNLQPDPNPLTFAIYSGGGLKKYPLIGTQVMTWDGSSQYEFNGKVFGMSLWDANHYVVIYSQDCPTVSSDKYIVKAKSMCPF